MKVKIYQSPDSSPLGPPPAPRQGASIYTGAAPRWMRSRRLGQPWEDPILHRVARGCPYQTRLLSALTSSSPFCLLLPLSSSTIPLIPPPRRPTPPAPPSAASSLSFPPPSSSSSSPHPTPSSSSSSSPPHILTPSLCQRKNLSPLAENCQRNIITPSFQSAGERSSPPWLKTTSIVFSPPSLKTAREIS